MCWITVNLSKTLKHIYVYIKTMCKIIKLYTQGLKSFAKLSVIFFHYFTLYNALIKLSEHT